MRCPVNQARDTELFEFGTRTARCNMTRVCGLPRFAVGAARGRRPHHPALGADTRFLVFDGDLDHVVGNVHIKTCCGCCSRRLGHGGTRAADASVSCEPVARRRLLGPCGKARTDSGVID